MSETTIMKTCTKCKEVKFLAEFYKEPRGKYGRFARCKLCCAEMRKRYRATEHGREVTNRLARNYLKTEKGKKYRQSEKWKEAHRKSDKKYRKTQKGQIVFKRGRKRYRSTEKYREANRRYMKKRYQLEYIKIRMKAHRARYKKMFPERVKAGVAVREAIRRKLIQKPTSFQCPCGDKAKMYHHHLGYAREHWLDVVAICYSCHTKIHKTGFLSSRTNKTILHFQSQKSELACS